MFRSLRCSGLGNAHPLHARAALGARFACAALVVETQPEVARARRAVLVGRAATGRASAVEAEPRRAVGIPSAFLSARPGAPLPVARTGNEEADASDAAAIVGGASRLVVTQAAAARLAFATCACAFDARCLTSAIAVGRTAAGLAMTIDTRLTGRARVRGIAPRWLARRFGRFTARRGAGDREYTGVKPLQVG